MMRAPAIAAAVVALLLAAACAPSLPASFTCTGDAQCRLGAQTGRCEASGACSFSDESCASGSRYGQFAPPGLAGACVDAVNGDGGGGSAGGGGGSAGGGGGGGGGTPLTHITRVGTSTVPGATHITLMLPAPTGMAVGDLVLAVVATEDGTTNVTAPAGFTLHQDLRDTLGGQFHIVYYQHFAAAAEPPSYTFTLSASVPSAAAAVAYRGVDSTMPFDAASHAQFEGTGTITAPSITTTRVNAYLVGMFVQANSGGLGWHAPPGMQVAVDGGDIGIFDVEQPAPGATGDKTATLGISAVPGIGGVDFVALSPKP